MKVSSNFLGWEVKDAEKAGFNENLLNKAINFAIDNESQMNRDIGAGRLERP